MTPETKQTLRKIGGIILLMWWTVTMVFVLTPQLMNTTFRDVVFIIVGAVGLGFILTVGIRLVVVNGRRKRSS